jgi:spore maturation protein CgeB
MKFVVFGLTVSSSWGNGHATLWRGLIHALGEAGHEVVFFERDVAYYADHRDLSALPGRSALVLYANWADVLARARRELADADIAMVTSFCPNGVDATALVGEANGPLAVFYDLDTPVTLDLLARGEVSATIGPRGLRDFDLVLSYTGGNALIELRTRLGARRVAPLYGHVDPAVHRPADAMADFSADFSYLGTYAADRQAALERLFIEPARRRPQRRFLIAGAQYPADFPWTTNIAFVRHLAPDAHPAFYASSRLTLNVTREAMAQSGWCPSGRLFEAAACGATLLSDVWEGLDAFFEPGREILLARTTDDALAALDRSPEELAAIGWRARERVLAEHTSAHRARDLIAAVEAARSDTTPAGAIPAELATPA